MAQVGQRTLDQPDRFGKISSASAGEKLTKVDFSDRTDIQLTVNFRISVLLAGNRTIVVYCWGVY